MKANPKLFQDALTAVRTSIGGGALYLYAGTVPANADDALDMVNTHTELAIIEANGGPLAFDPPVGNVLSKAAADTWEGLIAFDGKEAASGTLTATFFRLCPSGDNGRSAGTGPRVQGTVGGAASAADLKLSNPALTANGTNKVGTAIFNLNLNN